VSTSTARGRERKIDDPQAIGRFCGADDEVPCGHRHLQAPALLEGFSPKRVIADRAYDADSFIGKVWAFGAEAVIPTRHNRVEQREYDRQWYKNRTSSKVS
jgi:transposase